MTEKVIFHGGCVCCDSQTKFGKERCVGCCYFEANWDLPNLRINDKEIKIERSRKMFRLLAKLNPFKWKDKTYN